MEIVTLWHATGDKDDLRDDEDVLYRIFSDAVECAQLLRRQRTLWSVRFPSRPKLPKMDGTGPLMFDPACKKDDRMDDDELSFGRSMQRYMDIVVTPALFKRGTMNGELFESEEAATRAVVIVGSS
jgi:hypothetical protein